MGDLDRYIEGQQADGVVDSDGAFTVNVAKAKQKLARYQLKNPYDYMLRFVQAANLGAEAFDIDSSSDMRVVLQGWNLEYNTEKIMSAVEAPSFDGVDGALDYLRVGLAGLRHRVDGDVEVLQRIAGQKGIHRMRFDPTVSHRFDESQEVNQTSSLEIIWPQPQKAADRTYEWNVLLAELQRRTFLSKVPVRTKGALLKHSNIGRRGTHRDPGFHTNEAICRCYFRKEGTEIPPKYQAMRSQNRDLLLYPEGARSGVVELNVDLDPVMTVHLIKAGVIIDQKKRPSKVKGLIAYVDADELNTDLTGSQILESESEKLEEIFDWVEESGALLLEPAIKMSQKLEYKSGSDSGPWVWIVLLVAGLGIAAFPKLFMIVISLVSGDAFTVDNVLIVGGIVGAAAIMFLFWRAKSVEQRRNIDFNAARRRVTDELVESKKRVGQGKPDKDDPRVSLFY